MKATDNILLDAAVDLLQRGSLPLEKGKYCVWGEPQRSAVHVSCQQSVFREVERLAKADSREVGGILVGNAYVADGYTCVEITNCIPAPPAGRGQSSAVHFQFTPDTWCAMLGVKDREFDQLRVVGWYHSHPGHGIFLSRGMDTEIQSGFFAQVWQVALVYDPIRHEGGFFIWQNREITPAPGFYEIFDGKPAASYISWRNVMCSASPPDASAPPFATGNTPPPPSKLADEAETDKEKRFASSSSAWPPALFLAGLLLLVALGGYFALTWHAQSLAAVSTANRAQTLLVGNQLDARLGAQQQTLDRMNEKLDRIESAAVAQQKAIEALEARLQALEAAAAPAGQK